MFILYQITFAPPRKLYRIGLLFKNGWAALFLWWSEDAPRRSLEWKVTYRIGVHTILDSFRIVTKSYPDFLSVELGFPILIVSGILDSDCWVKIPNPGLRIQHEKIPGFWIPKAKVSLNLWNNWQEVMFFGLNVLIIPFLRSDQKQLRLLRNLIIQRKSNHQTHKQTIITRLPLVMTTSAKTRR